MVQRDTDLKGAEPPMAFAAQLEDDTLPKLSEQVRFDLMLV